MINKDLNRLEELSKLLHTESGKDMLVTDRDFRNKFIRLKKLLDNVNKYSAVPKEAFSLTDQLLQRLSTSQKEYDESLKKIDEKCGTFSAEYPFLFSQLKELARSDRGAIELVLKELID